MLRHPDAVVGRAVLRDNAHAPGRAFVLEFHFRPIQRTLIALAQGLSAQALDDGLGVQARFGLARQYRAFDVVIDIEILECAELFLNRRAREQSVDPLRWIASLWKEGKVIGELFRP